MNLLRRLVLLVLVLASIAGCTKVPLYDVGAEFALADAAWFEEEETLFIFWDLTAQQGLGPDTVMEITYQTDTEDVDWTPVTELPTVHRHVPVDCGIEGMCGSTSLHIDSPRKRRVFASTRFIPPPGSPQQRSQASTARSVDGSSSTGGTSSTVRRPPSPQTSHLLRARRDRSRPSAETAALRALWTSRPRAKAPSEASVQLLLRPDQAVSLLNSSVREWTPSLR